MTQQNTPNNWEPATVMCRVVKDGDCWRWTGSYYSPNGYGKLRACGRIVLAHRFAYQVLVGPIPPGFDLDHLCRNIKCVNPAHLEPVTERENVLRGTSPVAENARKTHCKRGHPLFGENLFMQGTARQCRECRRAKLRRWRARVRAACETIAQ